MEHKILIVGCGSIGKRHAENLKQLGHQNLIYYDTNKEKTVGNAFCSLDEAIAEKPDMALVCSPSAFHINQSMILAQNGINVFIEKPLSHNLDCLDEFVETINKTGITAMVGMCYRHNFFTKTIKEIIDSKTLGRVHYASFCFGQHLTTWHKDEEYSNSYVAKCQEGGGAALTIGSHVIDLGKYLFGNVIGSTLITDKISNLNITTDDIMFGTLKTDDGIYINYQIDMLQYIKRSDLSIVFEHGVAHCKYNCGELNVYNNKDKSERRFKNPMAIDFMYIDEIKHFINCIENNNRECCNVKDCSDTMKILVGALNNKWV